MPTVKRRPVIIVEGGQNGSEAKGSIAAHLCLTRDVMYAVRTGAINAGHSIVFQGKKYVNQQLPVGWVNPSTQLIIGAGGYIHRPTLLREIEMVNAAIPDRDVRDRLFIDYKCGTHTEEAEKLSKDANRHHRIGATGKGCSESIVEKIRNRNAGYKLFVHTADAPDTYGIQFTDTVRLLNKAIDVGQQVLIEGTQGSALDLHTGPYPFVTSRMTSAANWIAESGLSPALDYEVVLVCRTYPIRVAGNSGPMTNEIEWTDLARTINEKLVRAGKPALVSSIALYEFESRMMEAAFRARDTGRYQTPAGGRFNEFNIKLSTWTMEQRSQFRVAASELHRDALGLCSPVTVQELGKLFEMTTVTRKLRRIAELSIDDLKFAVAVNRPAWIALTFMDYMEPSLDPTKIAEFCRWVTSELGVPVRMFSTGPSEADITDVNRPVQPVHAGAADRDFTET